MRDTTDHHETPSEWAERLFEETGDVAYLELYNLWKQREKQT